MRRLRAIIAVAVVLALVAGCGGDWKPPRIPLPRRGPVEVFESIIDQVEGIGRGLTRQFRSLGGRH